MIAHTETGSTYEFDGLRVRRTGNRDGEWLTLQSAPRIRVGWPIVMYLEPLGEGDTTEHTTSRCTEVER